MRVLPWLLFLAACGGSGDTMPDAATDAASMDLVVAHDAPPPVDAPVADMLTCHTDVDGDGHFAQACGGDDCNDGDPNTYPGHPEVCDAGGHDEDCNPATLGPDADGDGFPSTACCNFQPSGTLLCGGDCDDTRATVNPTAAESCNGIDDNCNGTIDEGVVNTYGADCDGDGYGATTGTMTGCMAPTTPPTCATTGHLWVTTGGDCDDADASVHPSATEACNGIDDDCNGTVDDEPAADAACNVHSMGATCVSGACTTPTCRGTFLDCDPLAPGCETNAATDPANCGGCGNVCAHATCTGSSCVDDFVQISAGDGATCGVRRSGHVACWGWNTNGQLGDGTTVRRALPTAVVGITDAVQVSIGHLVGCARHAGGTVSCWGDNSAGGVGDGTTTDRHMPADVVGITDAADVTVGYRGVCVRHTTGALSCWGARTNGELGDGTMGAVPESVPSTVTGITTATAVACGGYYGCALLSDATLSCWGLDGAGQLADGGAATQSTPVASAAGLSPIQLSAGFDHGCALGTTGFTAPAVYCWGQGDSGQLGDGTSTNSAVPVAPGGIVGPIAVSAGHSHSCVIRGPGAGVMCWGLNDNGQLGDGTTVNRASPVALGSIAHVAQLAAGYEHTCALQTSGVVSCWGDNVNGALGDGTFVGHATPMPIVDP